MRVLPLILLLAAPAAADPDPTFDGYGLSAPPLGGYDLGASWKGLTLRGGSLGQGSEVLGRSGYWGLEYEHGGSGRWFDYDFGLQYGEIDLAARYGPIGGEVPAPGFESERIRLGSAYGRLGRAYKLYGDFDWGWSTLVRAQMTDLFPNVTADETLGLRYNLDERSSLGVFGGVTQGARLLSEDWALQWAATQKTGDLEIVNSPHYGISYWRETASGEYDYEAALSASEQPDADVLALTGRLARRDAWNLAMRIEDTAGGNGELERRRVSLAWEHRVGRDWMLGVQASDDSIRFGNVDMDDQQVGLTLRWSPRGKDRGPSFHARTGVQRQATTMKTPDEPGIQRELREAAAGLDGLAQRLQDALDSTSGAEVVRDLTAAWDSLPPEMRRLLNDEFGSVDPSDLDAQAIDDLLERARGDLASARAELGRLRTLLDDRQIVARHLVEWGRRELHKSIREEQVTMFGETVNITPARLVALAHAYKFSAGYPAPVSQHAAEVWVRRELGEECAGRAPADCVLQFAPEELRAHLKRLYGERIEAAIDDAVAWGAELARREINALLLQTFLAAEQLDQLTLGRGVRTGEMNEFGMRSSFKRLDRRRDQQRAAPLEDSVALAARMLEERAAADAADAARSSRERGARRLAEMTAGAAWPAGVSMRVDDRAWSPLFADYGEAKVFEFLHRCAVNLALKGGGSLEVSAGPGAGLTRTGNAIALVVPLQDPAFRRPQPGRVLDQLAGML